MDQDVLEGPEEGPSESKGILRWLIVALMFALIAGGGIWYYMNYINNDGKIQPSPSAQVTDAIWKAKSEKTVIDFFTYWSNSGSTGDNLINARKAKDMLTINAQAKLETYKDGNNNLITDISQQLDKFIQVTAKTSKIEIVSSSKIDEKNVQVKVKLIYSNQIDKIISLMSDNNIWLIDKIDNSEIPFQSSVQPSISATPQPGITENLTE